MTKIYSRYDCPPSEGITFTEPSQTMQNFADECDVNKIIQAVVRGFDEPLYTNAQRASYFDCTTAGDFQSAMDILNVAKSDFESLPATLRANFGNDLETYIAFMSDPVNHPMAVEMGLLSAGENLESVIPSSVSAPPPVGDLAPVQATE